MFSKKILTLITTSSFAFTLSLHASKFTGFYSFGDSLSDMGNIDQMVQGTAAKSSFFFEFGDFHYFNGRFGGGPLWHEILAPQLGTTSTLASCFAYGGAITKNQFTNGLSLSVGFVPGLLKQIDIFFSDNKTAFNTGVKSRILANQPAINYINNFFQTTVLDTEPKRRADPNAVYSIWGGMNNYRALNRLIRPLNLPQDQKTARFEEEVANTVADMKEAMTRLKNAGARNFIVGNLPGIATHETTLDPNFTNRLTEEDRRAAVNKHNIALNDMLREFAGDKNVRIIPLDTYSFGEEIKANPAEFGFTETHISVQEAAINPLTGLPRALPADADTYLFFDALSHLTRKGNEVLANYVFEVARAPESFVPLRHAVRQNLLQQDRLLQHRLAHVHGSSFDIPSVSGAFAREFSSLRPQNEGFYFTLADVQKMNYRPQGSKQNPGQSLYSLPNYQSDAANPFGIFISGDLSFAKRKPTDSDAGARIRSENITIGMDYLFTKNYRLGLAMHYVNGFTKMNENLGQDAMNGYGLSAFGSVKFGAFHADLIGTHGFQYHALKRKIPLLKREATSNPVSKSRSIGIYTGYDLKYGPLKIIPNLSLRYGSFDIHDFSENGAQSLNMYVHRQMAKTFVGSLGAEIGYSFKTPYGKFTPKIRGAYEHDFERDDRTLLTELLTLKGVPTRSTLAPKDKNWGRLGGGIEAQFSKTSSLNLDYETFVGLKKYSSHTLFAKYRLRF